MTDRLDHEAYILALTPPCSSSKQLWSIYSEALKIFKRKQQLKEQTTKKTTKSKYQESVLCELSMQEL